MEKEKVVQRIQNMLYYTCGCNKIEAKKVLNECLRLNKKMEDPHYYSKKADRLIKKTEREVNKLTEEISEIQNKLREDFLSV